MKAKAVYQVRAKAVYKVKDKAASQANNVEQRHQAKYMVILSSKSIKHANDDVGNPEISLTFFIYSDSEDFKQYFEC